VFNFAFGDDAPDKKLDALKLFKEIGEGKYEPYTSDYVLQVLREVAEPKQSRMIELISRHRMIFLEQSDEAERLAGIYVAEGAISARHQTGFTSRLLRRATLILSSVLISGI
jgi:hypothetical protein